VRCGHRLDEVRIRHVRRWLRYSADYIDGAGRQSERHVAKCRSHQRCSGDAIPLWLISSQCEYTPARFRAAAGRKATKHYDDLVKH